MHWSSDCGFVIPYTWEVGEAGSPELEEEYYYVNSEGYIKKLHTDGLSGINHMVFTSRGKAYWTDFTEFSLKRCDFLQGKAPEKTPLSGVGKTSRIAYAGNDLYILGFEGDAALYDVKKTIAKYIIVTQTSCLIKYEV